MDATVVVVPIRDRADRVGPLISNLMEATPEPYRVAFVIDADQPEIVAMVEAFLGEGVIVPPGLNYATKVNIGARVSSEPLIFTGATDLRFHAGWLAAIHRELASGAQVIGTCDGAPRQDSGSHSTHSLVTRRYMVDRGTIDEPGKILHEGYPHDFCDDELVATAKARGVYAHAFGSMVEHMHWSYGKAAKDESYIRTEPLGRQGIPLFESRRHLWEGLTVSR